MESGECSEPERHNYSIIASLAGTSYYGPVAGHGFETHNISVLRERRRKTTKEGVGEAKTDIQALPAEEAGDTPDGYVVLKRHEGSEQKGGAEDEQKGDEESEQKGDEEEEQGKSQADEGSSKDGK